MKSSEPQSSFSIRQYGLIIALVVIYAVLAFARPHFMSMNYMLTLLRQISINGILAVGVTYVLLTGGVDLSIGSLVALSGVMAAHFAHPGEYWLIASIFMGIITGMACSPPVQFDQGFLAAVENHSIFFIYASFAGGCSHVAAVGSLNTQY